MLPNTKPIKRAAYRRAVFLTVISLLLSGCGSAASTGSGSSSESALVSGVSSSASSDSVSLSVSSKSASSYDAEEAEDSVEENTLDDAASESSQMLVYTGYLEIETTNYDAASENIRVLIKEYDGIIEEESESNNNRSWYSSSGADDRYLSMTIRIPAEDYEEFLSCMEEESETMQVLSKESTVEDITQEYSSNETTLEALEIELERLLDMMEEAETISDMLSVEERLTEVETQLNQTKTKKDYYENLVSYSTVYLTLEEVREITVVTLSFSERVSNAIKDSCDGFVSFCQNFAVFVIYFAPARKTPVPVFRASDIMSIWDKWAW